MTLSRDHTQAGARTVTDLGGEWEFRPDPVERGEHYPDQLAYTHWDDARWMSTDQPHRDWSPVTVPGPWPLPAGTGVRTVWFRRTFTIEATTDTTDTTDAAIVDTATDATTSALTPAGATAPGAPLSRTLLQFDGINYRSDIWLNGHYLGAHEGYFAPIVHDVTALLRPANTLVVKVREADDVLGVEDQMGQFKRDVVGALGRWDMNDPDAKPAGIWAPVRLVSVAALAIDTATLDYRFVDHPDARDADREIAIDAVLTATVTDVAGSGRSTLEWRVAPVGFAGAVQTGGAEFSSLGGTRTVAVDLGLRVRPWWTWDLGPQRLYDIALEVTTGGVVSDRFTWRTGFRELSRGEGWDLRLNGVSVYQRGANYLSDLDLSSMTPARYATDVGLFRAANLNTVHPFCLVEAPALYEQCDAQGLIVYQDFPFWLMVDTSSETVTRSLAQFDELRALLAAHPSVAIWNFGSQPSVANVDKLCVALVDHARRVDPSRIAHHGNAAIATEAHDDVHATRSFFWRRADADRFVGDYDWRRDNHMYPGWYYGGLDAIAELPLDDFALVTEFGAQALPSREALQEFLDLGGAGETDDGAPIDWVGIARHCGQPTLLQRHNPDARDIDALIRSSQRYQAELVRHHTEFIRSRKGAPGRGLHLFAFNDCWPSVTWSVLDHERRPKAAFGALARAMEPVQVFLAAYRGEREPGEHELRLVAVNDGPVALGAVTVRVTVTDAAAPSEGGGGTVHEVLLAELPTDAAVPLAISVTLPERSAGAGIRLALEWAGGAVENDYRVPVAARE
jgi:beta-mannosidase